MGLFPHIIVPFYLAIILIVPIFVWFMRAYSVLFVVDNEMSPLFVSNLSSNTPYTPLAPRLLGGRYDRHNFHALSSPFPPGNPAGIGGPHGPPMLFAGLNRLPSTKSCLHCQGKHDSDRCYEKFPHLAPPGYKFKGLFAKAGGAGPTSPSGGSSPSRGQTPAQARVGSSSGSQPSPAHRRNAVTPSDRQASAPVQQSRASSSTSPHANRSASTTVTAQPRSQPTASTQRGSPPQKADGPAANTRQRGARQNMQRANRIEIQLSDEDSDEQEQICLASDY